MVKPNKSKNRQKRKGKSFRATAARARKINASTPYDTCTEQLSPFGGLLAVIKFLDLVKFEDIFNFAYNAPARKPRLGHHLMVVGILMLLFIGFNRLWHFTYVRLDALLCGFFRLERLPVASTFWRYLDSLGINQARSFLKITGILRERFWQMADLHYKSIHISIDTTVETIYGKQQGARKGHNTKHRGKKGYRPVLCFIDETREYLAGKLRRGETCQWERKSVPILGIEKCTTSRRTHWFGWAPQVERKNQHWREWALCSSSEPMLIFLRVPAPCYAPVDDSRFCALPKACLRSR